LCKGLGPFTHAEAISKDRTTANVALSRTTVQKGAESAARLSVTVRAHIGEAVPSAEHATVHVGKASCVVSLKDGKGSFRLGNQALPEGSYTVTVTYPGDANLVRGHGAATSRLTVTSS
jgi:hypothetical protein